MVSQVLRLIITRSLNVACAMDGSGAAFLKYSVQ